MQCPRCHHDNAIDAAFCEECGARVEATCASCGEANRAGAKFCRKCGESLTHNAAITRTPLDRLGSPASYIPRHLAEKILTSKAALEGERKQVTVLFADLKGSMELLADRDPEEARRILDPVLERMMEAVHRFEGTVNQVMGDGIMALFGAPLAHEDHATRGCYAALRMQERVKRYADEVRRAHAAVVKIRVGLNSGEVVVRAIGSDLSMDYTAVGQTTHLAARMEQLADPGAIVVTPDTLALVEGYVEVKPLGPVRVKGLAEPLEIYEVTAAGTVRTRLQASARRGLTRFVGRDTELTQLRRAKQRAAEGHGQVAAIVGEAGVGKSRLVYELTHSHRLQGWLTLESASVSYGKATSWLPVIELLKGYFKIGDRDEHKDIREKVTGKLLTLDRALEPTLSALLALLDVPIDDPSWSALDPEQRRRRTLDAVKRLLLREAREQPLLVIFEDLHWIDGETQALLDSLVESIAPTRMLLLVNYRPEYRHGWNGKTYYGQLRLDALPVESTTELLDALLGTQTGLEPLKQMLVKRGNPFFLEETVRTLIEIKVLVGSRGSYRLAQSIQTVQVPPTVQAVLAARIDRLSADDKRLLQVASVIGKDVSFELLQAIAALDDDALRKGLDRLQAGEFLYEMGLYPDIQYMFKHALTHDVTYGGLLHERRRELHAKIVGAIEALYAGRQSEYIELLAHHAFRGDMGEKAVDYLRQAGSKAAARSAPADARIWFEQALTVIDLLPQSRFVFEQAFDIRLELRGVLSVLSEVRRMLEILREAESLADRLNDDDRRGRALMFIANTLARLGDAEDQASSCAAAALEIGKRVGDLRLQIPATTVLCQINFLRGEYERVVQLTTANLAITPAEWVNEIVFGMAQTLGVGDRRWLVESLAQLGRFDEAGKYAAEAVRLAEPTQHAYTLGVAYRAASMLHVAKGDWAQALHAFEEGNAIARTGNVINQVYYGVAYSSWMLAQLGETTQAEKRLLEGEQLTEWQIERGRTAQITAAFVAMGRAALLLDRLYDAQRFADRAITFSAGFHGYAAYVFHLVGDIAAHPDRFDAGRSEDYYRQSLHLAEPRGMRPLVAHCHRGLAKLYHHTGRSEQAQRCSGIAMTMYRDMGMRYWVEIAEKDTQTLMHMTR